jgi:peroxiredoxin Q/BCP
MAGRVYMGILRSTFVIDTNGVVERVITKVDTKNAAKQILDTK